MRIRLSFIGRGAIALLLGSVLGCNSGNSGPSSSTITPAGLATDLATAFCTTCCDSSTATGPDGGTSACAGTVDGGSGSCLDRASLSANQQLSLISTAFNEGLVTIDPATSTSCAAAYQQNVVCTGDGPDVEAAVSDPTCAALFVGYIPVGERCDMTAECTSGSYCLSQGTGQAVTSIFGSGSLGTCFAYQTVGQACNSTPDCMPPATCNQTSFLCE